MNPTVAARIKNARLLHGLSLQEVANTLGVSKQMINKYEQGFSSPTSEKLIQLARLFKVKSDYFFRPFQVEIGEVNFRKKASFSAKKQDALKEKIRLEMENYLWIEDILQIDSSFENSIGGMKIKSAEDVVAAVLKLRNDWNIGLEPAHNLIQLLEDKEIKVVELHDVDDSFDGLATFVNDKYPVIVVNAHYTVERKRFTLLHELGHLLMNLPECDRKVEENYCNLFAAEFLFPREMVMYEFGPARSTLYIEELEAVQEKYGISIQAIIYRLTDIGIIHENKKSVFYKTINANPELKNSINQPRFATPEKSERFQQLVFRALSQENISISKASSLLNRSISELRESTMF